MIENGKITAPIRNVNLIGNGPDVLTKVTAVGNDFDAERRPLDLRQGRSVACPSASASRRCSSRGMTVGGTRMG